jgi:hypothetical protein
MIDPSPRRRPEASRGLLLAISIAGFPVQKDKHVIRVSGNQANVCLYVLVLSEPLEARQAS